jgi:TRAP transporter TAXI family solute receptor
VFGKVRLVALIMCLLLAACTRGPGSDQIEGNLQARLDEQLGRQVLQVSKLRRQGSSPLGAASDGAERALVYYNAVLRFADDYDASDWAELSPAVLAQSLGATEEGVSGFRRGGNEPGSELHAYGTVAYRRAGDGWELETAVLPAEKETREQARLAATEGSVPSSRAAELVRRLASLLDTTPGFRSVEEQIIEDELDRAYRKITLRLERNRDQLILAAGLQGGEYWRFVHAFANDWQPGARPVIVETQGSVSNARLVDAGSAQIGLMQSDVAAAAIAGEGPFSASGPLRRVRALASLVPEPLHVVVRMDSGIQSVHDLRDRRVGIGPEESGGRFTTDLVLRAHGLEFDDLAETFTGTPVEGLRRLVGEELDAVIMAVAVPWRQLSVAAEQAPLRLLSLDEDVISHVNELGRGLVPMVVAGRSYPGQANPVRTVAATALIVANADLADVTVESLLEVIFAEERVDSARTARISRDKALVGVTVPLHDGAARFYGRSPNRLRPAGTKASLEEAPAE